jgi:hypothetical protein
MLVIAVRFVEALFVIGGVGCLVVLILTGIEDVRTLIGLDEKKETSATSVARATTAEHPTHAASAISH